MQKSIGRAFWYFGITDVKNFIDHAISPGRVPLSPKQRRNPDVVLKKESTEWTEKQHSRLH